MQFDAPYMHADFSQDSRDELMGELVLIDRQLQAADEPTTNLMDALIDVTRALKLPIHQRRADARLFIESTQSVSSATWDQCGGLVFALAQREVVDPRAFASRVAQRIFELTPTHY